MRPGRVPRVLLAALLAVDLLLLVGNLLHLRVNEPHEPVDPVFSRSVWNGSLDGSHVEMAGHGQLAVAAALLIGAGVVRRSAVPAAWGGFLVAVVADDVLRLHERLGAVVVRRLDLEPVAGLRAADQGELAVWAVGAAGLLPGLLLCHRRCEGADRRLSAALFRLLAALAVFAVLLDMAHIALAPSHQSAPDVVLTLAETTGELGVMTAMLLIVVRAARALSLWRPTAPVTVEG